MNRMQRSKILGPMLYIQQPAMILPNIKMQERFRSKGDSILNAETELIIEKVDSKEIDTAGQVEKVEIEVNNLAEEISKEIFVEEIPPIDDISINNNQSLLNSTQEEIIVFENKKDTPKKRRGFNDLGMDEKLLFLKKVPAHIARIRYKFIAADKEYIGYFLESKGDTILITNKKNIIEILYDSLVDIKIYGL